jgi:hypothetical protein
MLSTVREGSEKWKSTSPCKKKNQQPLFFELKFFKNFSLDNMAFLRVALRKRKRIILFR